MSHAAGFLLAELELDLFNKIVTVPAHRNKGMKPST
jgi:hypothetical protein